MLLAFGLAVALLGAIPTYGPIPQPSPSVISGVPKNSGEALIVNSGSTNRAGYRLRVYAGGWTALQQGDMPVRKRVPSALIKRFFADLHAAGPLDQLPAANCMKSASFGSSTRVAYRGTLSPDLTCPSRSAAARALAVDADALAAAAGVSMLPRPLTPP